MQGQLPPATVQSGETKAEDRWYRWDIREASWGGLVWGADGENSVGMRAAWPCRYGAGAALGPLSPPPGVAPSSGTAQG